MDHFQMPLTVAPLFEQYYPENNKGRQILVEHSYLVARKSLEIASLHPNWNLDLNFIEEAAWLHDIGVNACDAPKIGCHGKLPYIYHGVVGSQRLHDAGMDRHALVAERHIGTGLTLENVISKGWKIPHKEYVPTSIEEIIICVADKFFSKSFPEREKSIDEVLTSIARYGEDDIQRFKTWYTMLFVDSFKSPESSAGEDNL